MYFRRLTNPDGPWTDDPVLATYRFTNAYRASDRVSQYLIREVQYHPDRPSAPAEVFFRTMLFKIFNRIDTWETLERKVGQIVGTTADINSINAVLNEMFDQHERLYSAAYIMPSPAFGHVRKHTNHLALLARMMEDKLPVELQRAGSLREVYDLLVRYPGIGPFLAFQYAIDLNYSTLIDHSEADFVVAGPGALDGISKCFTSIGSRTPEQIIHQVCEMQEKAFAKAGLKFQPLYGRRLQPIDCQNLFCEISKYARVVHPNVSGLSGRTRIKQTYRFNSTPLPTPMYPPKWNLNTSAGGVTPKRTVRHKRDLMT